MPRSTVYPNQGFQRSFNQGTTYPYARYDSDEEENELDRARELYKNLQGSPGGWQTRALQEQSQQLKRRLGETEKSFQEREVEYKRRLREGEDAQSLLGSQLDESRSQYGNLQRQLDDVRSQYSDLQSQFGGEQSLYQGRIADWQRKEEEQQRQFDKSIHKPEIADQILRKKYNLEKSLYDMTMKKPWPEIKNYADEQGYTGNYKKYAGQYISGAPQQKPFMSYEDFEKRNHNKAFMRSLMPQFERVYPKGSMDEAQYLTHLGYGDPTYAKDPVSFLKQHQKYYPFAKEETYQKYPTVDRFRDLSPASKQYLNIDQPNLKNIGKIYKQKLRDQESMAASDLQSQMERMSESYDSSMDSFANLLKERNPEAFSEIMSKISDASQTPKFSEFSRYSSWAPSSFAESIRSAWDSDRQRGRAREIDLNQIRRRFDQEQKDYNQFRTTSEQDKRRLTQESSQWKAKHDALLPVIQEYENYRRDVSPLRREHPVLKKFRQDYNHVNLNEYAKIPAMRQTLQNAPREAAALYKDAVDFYNSRHRNSYGKDYPGTISWGKKFGLL